MSNDSTAAPPGPVAASRLSRRGRIAIALLGSLSLGLLGLAVYHTLRRLEQGRPSTGDMHDVAGDHPGDLKPGMDREDNLRRYGLDQDVVYHFRTNRLGFRGDEPSERPNPLVVVLGDSYVFGMGVDQGATFPEQLSLRLQGRAPRIGIHNAGVPGYTITAEIEFWREKVSRLRPALVLLCHDGSDIKEMARPTSFRRMLKVADRDAGVAAVLARGGGDKDQVIASEYVFTTEALAERLGDERIAGAERLQASYIEGVLALDGEVRAAGSRLVLVLWREREELASLDVRPVEEAARSAGIPVFAGMRALSGRPNVRPPDRYFLPDGHFSAEGLAVAAEQTAAWLVDQGLAPTPK